MISESVGHYRILGKIGSGGMGEVFHAHDKRLGRNVALKFIHPASASDPDRVRRFEYEARAAAALNHPNIVLVYDCGLHDNSPYIVTELLEGCTLRERLLSGPLPVRLAAEYGKQIAQGLMAAHEKLIVHRDLKPDNLFITREGRIKILDFGIAKLIPAGNGGHSLGTMATQTRMGAMMGTVAYMSPEQLRSKPIDGRSDIFSMGAILYEMLTGKRAFHGETDVDTITAVLRETPQRMSTQRENIPQAFECIVDHCLEKEPEKRFQSARDLAFALGTLTEAEPAPQEGEAVRSWRWMPLWLGMLLLGAVVAAGAWWLLPQLRIFNQNPQYQRLTFERGTVYGARFAPDGNVVYEAAWNGRPSHLFETVAKGPQTRSLAMESAHLLAVSPSSQLALQVDGTPGAFLDYMGGALARAPLAGGSPRELMEDVRWADWDPHGELAVVHEQAGHSRLEYPLGKVLYQSAGWIGNIRFSPDGQMIAFMEHPTAWDDRGNVAVVDLNGTVTRLSPSYASETGLAWRAAGNEIWYSAAEAGNTRRLMAVTLGGKVREVMTDATSLTLQDISPDGRVLMTAESPRLTMEALAPGDREPRDLSWYDDSVAKDISPDGRWILFEEYGEPFGPNYAVAARNLDGSPPIHLGEGTAGGLSPDGRWALTVAVSDVPRVTMLPVGPGQARDIPVKGLERVQSGSAHFLPDGAHILVNGNQAGHGTRGYVLDLVDGKPHPVTPEGVEARLVSPDGRWLLAQPPDGPVMVYPLPGGSPRDVPGLTAEDQPAQWGADSASFYVYRVRERPVRVERVQIATGKRTLVRELRPSDRQGFVSLNPLVMTVDGREFAYSYYQNISSLYVVRGLK